MGKPPVVWNKTVRLIHWTVAVSVLTNIYILEEGDDPHKWIGYLAAAAVGFRIILGLYGKGAVQFKNFPLHFPQIKLFTFGFFKKPYRDYQGHNPLASYVYIGIWVCVLALGLTGFLMGTDRFWGEEWLQELHFNFSTTLLWLFIIHMTGIMIDAVKFRRATWKAMITGGKS